MYIYIYISRHTWPHRLHLRQDTHHDGHWVQGCMGPQGNQSFYWSPPPSRGHTPWIFWFLLQPAWLNLRTAASSCWWWYVFSQQTLVNKTCWHVFWTRQSRYNKNVLVYKMLKNHNVLLNTFDPLRSWADLLSLHLGFYFCPIILFTSQSHCGVHKVISGHARLQGDLSFFHLRRAKWKGTCCGTGSKWKGYNHSNIVYG